MMKESHYRIGKVTMFFMLFIALLFDLSGGLAAKIFHLMGLIAASAVGWIPLFGSMLGGFAFGAGIVLGEFMGMVVLLFAYLTFYMWFMFHRTPILSGKNLGKRFAIFAATGIIEMVWFLNIAPAFTVWVLSMIILSRMEDREAFNAKMKIVTPRMRRYQKLQRQRREVPSTTVPGVTEVGDRQFSAANDNRLPYEEQIAV